jgi:hypothetical protein
MADSFEVTVRVDAGVIVELAQNYVEYMELPEAYDRTELETRLSADPDFRQLVIDEFTTVFQDIAADHWGCDVTEGIGQNIGRVGWLAEFEQDINAAAELAEFERKLMQEGHWVLEVASARKMLEKLGYHVERPPAPRKIKKIKQPK